MVQVLFLFIVLLLCVNAWATPWIHVGPDGGDARSLACDPGNPSHIFLGTSTGTIFQSMDGGRSWTRLVHLGKANDFVIDHVVVDPNDANHIYVGAWSLDNHRAGDLFRSVDAGKSWIATPALHGKSIRAMAMAESDSKVLIVGALDGVFRSSDGGRMWRKISGQRPEIRNVESIAIDPSNSNVVYAGTWHLGWKTLDGGGSWHRLQDGIIDDSDVFSIVVDVSHSQTVFLSACSGIYTSFDSGRSFDRIEGMPFSARRTRVLKQDPSNASVIYAGTTEGLWVTDNAGTTWKRVTTPELVVNDILVDPRDPRRVLLATDRAGVLVGEDRSLNFAASNSGFTHRYISSILVTQTDPKLLYAGIVNDREFGGVFVSKDAGEHWNQISTGLDGRDVFTLKETPDGSVLAGTNRGMFVLVRNSACWMELEDSDETSHQNRSGQNANLRVSTSDLRVNDVEITPGKWLAATSAGLFRSSDEGKTWRRDGLGKSSFVSVKVRGHLIAVASARKVLVSIDDGRSWRSSRGLASSLNGLQSLTIAPGNRIIVASGNGVFLSRDLGKTWSRIYRGLPSRSINYITYDCSQNRLLATSAEKTSVYESRDGGSNWRRQSETGLPLRMIGVVGGKLLAATQFDGLILQTLDANQNR